MSRETKQAVSILLGLVFVWAGLRFLLPVLLPFLLGAGMALMAEPGVAFLSRRFRLPRGAAAGIGVAAVFAMLCLLVTAVLFFFLKELGILAGILPDMELTVRSGLEALQGWALTMAERTPESVRTLLCRNVRELFSGGSALLDKATRYALGLAGTVLSNLPSSALGAGTAVLSAFLISTRLPQIRQWLGEHLRQSRLAAAADTLKQMKHTAWLWGKAQLKLAGVTCLILTAGFLILGIGYGPLWAVLVALVDAIPVLGTGTVLIPWSLICLLRQESGRALGLLGIYAVAALTRSLLEPRFVGRQLGLDPLLTLMAMYTGLRLWGVAGMLLMPLAAMMAVKIVKRE